MFANVGRRIHPISAAIRERDVGGILIGRLAFAKETESRAATANIGWDVQTGPCGIRLPRRLFERETEQSAIRLSVAGAVLQVSDTHVGSAAMGDEENLLDTFILVKRGVRHFPAGPETGFHAGDTHRACPCS